MAQNIDATMEAALEQTETWPIRLFEIGGNPILYFTDGDKAVSFGGNTYQPRGVSYRSIKMQRDIEIDKFEINLDNIDDALITWALTVDPTGFDTNTWKGVTDGATNKSNELLLIGNARVLIFGGRNTSVQASDEFRIIVKSNIDFFTQPGPKATQDITCRFKGANGFKGPNCGYSGPETICDYKAATCVTYGNFPRFGGFPDLTTVSYG